jgi:hypothetical protein
MHEELLASLRRLPDDELAGRVKELAARERGATVGLVAHLAELDTREVHFRAGHGSLFAYCREVLALSEQEAYNRIAVARAARRFPVVLDLLESGALSLTTVRMLAPHLTRDNHQRVLESARGQPKARVEEIAAALWPRPDAPALVRKLPAPRPLAVTSPSSGSTPPGPVDSNGPGERPAPAAAPYVTGLPPTPRRSADVVVPLAPERYRVQVTIGGETLEKLRLAKDLLRHAVPSGDEAEIFDRALTALLADIAQKRFGATEKPRAASPPGAGSRHVPAEVRRKVWLRDIGRCAFVGTTGRRCEQRSFLEFHHVKPFALGGEATPENIQLRCRSHNAYEARLHFANDGWDGSGNGEGAIAPRTRPGTSPGPAAAKGPAP